MSQHLVKLKPVEASDADELFPMIYQTAVTETIQWDGPESLEKYREGLAEREQQTKAGKSHLFTIVEVQTGKKMGSIDMRPFEEGFRGDMGLWIGEKFQGKGYATQAIAQILEYGFEKLKMEKIEAQIFLGNASSRRVFEKNGFRLEGTTRKYSLKRGKYLDAWSMGITKEDFVEIRRS